MKRQFLLILGSLLVLFAAFPAVGQQEILNKGQMSKEESQKLIHSVLKTAEANYERNLDEMEDYAFYKETQEFIKKKDGTLLPDETLLYFSVFSKEYEGFRSKLIKVDGKEPSGKAKEAHDKREEKGLKARLERRKSEKSGTKRKRTLELTSPEVLSYLIFERMGEAEYEGEPAEIIRFMPDPSVKPKKKGKTRQEKMVSKILRHVEGEFWVSKESKQLLKLNYRLTDKVKPVFFAKIKSFSMSLEMQKVDGTYWFPKRIETHAEGRAFFFGFKQHDVVKQYDFRRFQVDVEDAQTIEYLKE